ncbi:hypothetical protein MUK42_12670 [Musa troglodytarum]|uniref:Uncharacterized protein n=1 Tax=Musa troglodytarum TaxID=320322 RepID=A0A9E7GWF2_9LILI|nr:hypothetical protein MUK42_12670 [Musa troglodytarum]
MRPCIRWTAASGRCSSTASAVCSRRRWARALTFSSPGCRSPSSSTSALAPTPSLPTPAPRTCRWSTSPSASSPAPTSPASPPSSPPLAPSTTTRSLNPSSRSSMPTSCSPSGLTSLPSCAMPSSAAPATSTSCLMTWPSPTSPTVSSSPAPLRRSRWLSKKPSDPNSWSPVQNRSGALPSSAPRVRARLPSSSPMLPLLRALVSSSSAASRLLARSPPHSPGRPTLSTSPEVTTCFSGSTPPAWSKAGEGCDLSSCFLFSTPLPSFSFPWNSNLPTRRSLGCKVNDFTGVTMLPSWFWTFSLLQWVKKNVMLSFGKRCFMFYAVGSCYHDLCPILLQS